MLVLTEKRKRFIESLKFYLGSVFRAPYTLCFKDITFGLNLKIYEQNIKIFEIGFISKEIHTNFFIWDLIYQEGENQKIIVLSDYYTYKEPDNKDIEVLQRFRKCERVYVNANYSIAEFIYANIKYQN